MRETIQRMVKEKERCVVQRRLGEIKKLAQSRLRQAQDDNTA